MISPRRVLGLASFPLFLGIAASPPEALPQTPPQADEAESFDPYAADPGSAGADGSIYARLRHIEGAVALRRDSQVREDLTLNEPVVPGDRIDTAEGRAEIQFSDGTLLRLDRGTALVVRSLADNANQIENSTILQLPAGSLIVRTDRIDSRMERFQIDTPAASVFILSEGLFRIDVRPEGPTVVASRGGAAEVMAMDVSNIVRSGERSFVTPGLAPLEPQIYNTLRADAFDDWSGARDEALLWRETAQTRIPPGLPDPVEPYAEELSYHGQWIHTPSYGWVWRPVGVTQDWRPYYHGRWVWSPAGMVWASYEPWGWAPYHYGRWEFLVGGGWVWIPGYVYSGAHVAWLYSPGYFGWAPLGYYDYPVHIGFHFGLFHSPWVYVHGHHLYHHDIYRVCVKEKTIIHEIEKKYVVVGGSPRIRPDQVATRPRLAEEAHRRVDARREIQMDTTSRDGRRVPFNVTERQQLARATSQRARETGVGVRSVGRNGGRPVSLVPQTRGVTVPRAGGTTTGTRRPGERTATTPAQPQGAPAAQPSQQPRQRQLRTGPAPAEESVPRQVIPRIIPRGANGGNASSPGATTRQPSGSSDGAAVQPPQQQPGRQAAPRAKTPARRQPKKTTTEGEKPAEEKPPEGSGGQRASRASYSRADVIRASRPTLPASSRPAAGTAAPGRPAYNATTGRSGARAVSAPAQISAPARTGISAPARTGVPRIPAVFKPRAASNAPAPPAARVSAPVRSSGAPKASVSPGGGGSKAKTQKAPKAPRTGRKSKNR